MRFATIEAVSLAALFSVIPLHPDVAQVPPAWTRIGKAREWARTVIVTTMNGHFWSVEADGTMFDTAPDGRRTRYALPGTFYGTTSLVGLNGVAFQRAKGLDGNVIRMAPPMCITAADIDFAVEVL